MSSHNPLAGNPLTTRADAQQAVRDLVEPLVPSFTEQGALARWGSLGATFDERAEALEGVARPLWGLAPLAAGGGEFAHWPLIRTLLVHGTDPDHPEYWGTITTTDQRQVETAAIGLALALAPHEVWEPLTQAERDQLVEWLRPVFTVPLVMNNWQFFRVLVYCGLRHVGVEVPRPPVEESLRLIESFYRDEGWYVDGVSEGTDFYIAFAMHFYGLIYATLCADEDPERAQRFRDRARQFAPDWESRFDARGRVIAYGRSLTYRFAGAGFFGALAFADVDALPWGQVRELWFAHLRWWAEQQATDDRGILTLGWGYANLFLSEPYNSGASPYWAMKAFLPLALPEEHPFWSSPAPEQVAPEQGCRPQPRAGVVVHRTPTQSIMLNAGPGDWDLRQGSAKYGKFAYSSAFPFSLEPDDPWSLETAESTLAFIDAGRLRRETRRTNEAWGVEGDIAWARWQVFGDQVRVTTFLRGSGAGHVRVHVIDSHLDTYTVEGGFALPTPRTRQVQGLDGREVDTGLATLHSGHAHSTIMDAAGVREGLVRNLQPNTSLQWARATAPMLTGTLAAGHHVLVTLVAAVEDEDLPEQSARTWLDEDFWQVADRVCGETVERPSLPVTGDGVPGDGASGR